MSNDAADFVARIATNLPAQPTTGDVLKALTRCVQWGETHGYHRGFMAGQQAVANALDAIHSVREAI